MFANKGQALLISHNSCMKLRKLRNRPCSAADDCTSLPVSFQVRQDAGLFAKSKLEILCAEGDMYVSRTTGKHGSVMLKLGPRYDIGKLCPKPEDGWEKVAKGKDYCVWLKMHEPSESTTVST